LLRSARALLVVTSLVASVGLVTACAPRTTVDAARMPASSNDAASKTAEPKSVGVGDRAPVFRLASLESGAMHGLPNGRVTIVVFWATWSHPDVRELTKLQEIYVRHAPRGLAVIGVSIDDAPDHVQETAKTYGAQFPIVWDGPNRPVTNIYRPDADPSTYVIDRQGIVRFVLRGYHDGSAADVEAAAAALL
jgi:peroxiredoxin